MIHAFTRYLHGLKNMSDTNPNPLHTWSTRPIVIIIAGCLIALIGFGIRSSFGLFLEPMTVDRGWGRETFALALAIQNLLWGAGVPIAGAIADRRGAAPVLILGALIYCAGIAGMAVSDSATLLHLTGGLLTGVGVAFTGFAIALSAIAKAVGKERRSLALGLGTAAGSLGQVIFSPLSQLLIETSGWYGALLILASLVLVIIPVALLLPYQQNAAGEAPSSQTLAEALQEAAAHRGYVLLTAGFLYVAFMLPLSRFTSQPT